MTFKKDYINYLLYTVVNSAGSEYRESYRLSKLVDTIMSIDDVMKVTYLVGKTAGLEGLFKYLLYVSDKIDKSQVTIFNLKDNFDYDVKNLQRICDKIKNYKTENVQEAIENITEEMAEEAAAKDAISINVDDNTGDSRIQTEEAGGIVDDSDEESGDAGLTLIENTESYSGETEVFELESITDSVENSENVIESKDSPVDEENDIISDDTDAQTDEEEMSVNAGELTGDDGGEEADEETDDEEIADEKIEDEELFVEEVSGEPESGETVVFELEQLNDVTAFESEEYAEGLGDIVAGKQEPENEAGEGSEEELREEITENMIVQDLPELEIEVHKPMSSGHGEEHVKEEAITNEAYYKFETKFFEEVKILEKLLATVDKDNRIDEEGKLDEKCLQCLTEIIEITSELSSLARQLSFDLIADIFLTMNLYFTKAISQPDILTGERIKLLDSSLALVNSLIKGEDYLNYDTIVDKIEQLKVDISGEEEEKYPAEEMKQEEPEAEKVHEEAAPEKQMKAEAPELIHNPVVKQSQMDSAVFKLKYLVKEFEKSFVSIGTIKGEYSKFDALEKIGELNNALRLIAKIAAIVKLNDVLKLAEVTYVFLKYVKDYRMDLMEPEIKQIVKYIIFTFKMLLTNRKPEDFNVLVQHLNNPVKIFADS